MYMIYNTVADYFFNTDELFMPNYEKWKAEVLWFIDMQNPIKSEAVLLLMNIDPSRVELFRNETDRRQHFEESLLELNENIQRAIGDGYLTHYTDLTQSAWGYNVKPTELIPWAQTQNIRIAEAFLALTSNP